jgi:hypothetical protein
MVLQVDGLQSSFDHDISACGGRMLQPVEIMHYCSCSGRVEYFRAHRCRPHRKLTAGKTTVTHWVMSMDNPNHTATMLTCCGLECRRYNQQHHHTTWPPLSSLVNRLQLRRMLQTNTALPAPNLGWPRRCWGQPSRAPVQWPCHPVSQVTARCRAALQCPCRILLPAS